MNKGIIASSNNYFQSHVPHIKIDTINLIPNELLSRIFSFLKKIDLVASAIVCKKWHIETKEFVRIKYYSRSNKLVKTVLECLHARNASFITVIKEIPKLNPSPHSIVEIFESTYNRNRNILRALNNMSNSNFFLFQMKFARKINSHQLFERKFLDKLNEIHTFSQDPRTTSLETLKTCLSTDPFMPTTAILNAYLFRQANPEMIRLFLKNGAIATDESVEIARLNGYQQTVIHLLASKIPCESYQAIHSV